MANDNRHILDTGLVYAHTMPGFNNVLFFSTAWERVVLHFEYVREVALGTILWFGGLNRGIEFTPLVACVIFLIASTNWLCPTILPEYFNWAQLSAYVKFGGRCLAIWLLYHFIWVPANCALFWVLKECLNLPKHLYQQWLPFLSVALSIHILALSMSYSGLLRCNFGGRHISWNSKLKTTIAPCRAQCCQRICASNQSSSYGGRSSPSTSRCSHESRRHSHSHSHSNSPCRRRSRSTSRSPSPCSRSRSSSPCSRSHSNSPCSRSHSSSSGSGSCSNSGMCSSNGRKRVNRSRRRICVSSDMLSESLVVTPSHLRITRKGSVYGDYNAGCKSGKR